MASKASGATIAAKQKTFIATAKVIIVFIEPVIIILYSGTTVFHKKKPWEPYVLQNYDKNVTNRPKLDFFV